MNCGKNVTYKCQFCNESFSKSGDLKIHMNKVNKCIYGQRYHKCDSCGKSFSQAQKLKTHINAVHKAKTIENSENQCVPCAPCDAIFKKLRKVIRKDEQKPFRIIEKINEDEENKVSNSKHDLKTDINEKKSLCIKCGKNIQNNLDKKIHKCPSEKIFTCFICGANFFSRKRVYTHVKQVHDIKCAKYQDYDQYVRIAKFHCDICDKSFSLPGTLAVHNIVFHKFKCTSCKKSFNKKTILNSHFKNVHEGKKNELIKITFENSALAVKRGRPKKEINSDSNQCAKCGKKFTNSGNKNKHVKLVHEKKETNSYKCNLCDKAYNEKYKLKRHIESIHKGAKPFKCKLCGHSSKYKSDLKSHINDIHNKIKDHKCKHCGKSFAQTGSLKKHYNYCTYPKSN